MNNTLDIDGLTLGQAKQIAAMLGGQFGTQQCAAPHPMLGRRCVIRTYSAGVHIGKVEQVSPDGMGVLLSDALRLWKWEGGGLSLSVVASAGIKGGRLNRTGEVYLTNAIEFIPTTTTAEESYERFVEA